MLRKENARVLRVPEYIVAMRQDPAKIHANGLKTYGKASKILDALYLGSCFNARDSEFLESSHITHIVNVAEEIDIQEQEGVISQRVVITDDPQEGYSVEQYLQTFIQAIQLIGKLSFHSLCFTKHTRRKYCERRRHLFGSL